MPKIRFPHLHINRRKFVTGAAAGLALAGLTSPFGHRAKAAGVVQLRLLETTDVHVHVHPYDYYRDRPDNTVGLSKTAALVAQARAEAPNSLLFDNGDFLQGNPMGDFYAYERGLQEGDVHPVIRAMNLLKIDGATLGNHEFNYGLSFLEKALSGSEFPFALANVANGALAGSATADETLVPPYFILDRTVVDGQGNELPIKVGVIGFTPPQIMVWDSANLEGNVAVRDIVASAQAYVPQMKEEGADIIIALSHSGIEGGIGPDGAENASLLLAGVPGIDAIFTGHHHRLFPSDDYAEIEGADIAAGTLQGVPAAMPGFWGSHLGVIDLMLEHDGSAWRTADFAVESRPIYERIEREVNPLAEPVAAILAATQEDHDATLAYVRRPVGKTSAPLHSYFALVADDPSVQIVSQAQLWYTASILKGSDYEGLPILSAAAPFKAGGRGGPEYYTDVPAGDVAIKNVADLYLYPNTARAVLIDGATVKEWLERSAGIFNQLSPDGGPQELINNEFPSYNFDVIDGVSYKIDLSQPSKYDPDGGLLNPDASRITDLQYNGAPIDPAQQFVVATNNYRAGGGGNFPGIDGSNIIVVAPDTNRDVIVRFIVEKGTINPSADANWTFAPIAGVTEALFVSGPAAQAYAGQVPGVSYKGEAADGFGQYALDLTG